MDRQLTFILFLFSLTFLTSVKAEEKCGESSNEDKKLFWSELSKIEFLAQIPFKIPSGLLCAGFKSTHKQELMQVSYKTADGSLRVFNRKFFLGIKRTVIKSDDFIQSSLLKVPLPILSFLISNQTQFYTFTVEYINQMNPFMAFDEKKQKYVAFELHLDKKQNALFYPKDKLRPVSKIQLEIDALFNIHKISLFNRQDLISSLKTQDL